MVLSNEIEIPGNFQKISPYFSMSKIASNYNSY